MSEEKKKQSKVRSDEEIKRREKYRKRGDDERSHLSHTTTHTHTHTQTKALL